MDDTLVRAFLTLMACVAVIGLVLWWVKRKTSRARVGDEELSVRILARQALSPKANVSIVQIGDRTLILGVTEQSVQLLSELGLPAMQSTQNLAPVFTRSSVSHRSESNANAEHIPSIQQSRDTRGFAHSPPPQPTLDPIQPAYGVPAPISVPDLSIGSYLRSLFRRSP